MRPMRAEKAGLLVAGATLLALLTIDEGTRYTPYRDIGGVLTVCQGHTGPDIIEGKRYTKKECDELLVKDTTKHGLGVLRCTKVPLNQNQYDAYTRFTINLGVSTYCNSNFVKKLNQGDYPGACRGMLDYKGICLKRDAKGKCAKGKYKVIPGLVNRRQSEYQQCMTPVKPIQEPKTLDTV